MREDTVRGPAIDLGEFERRLRGPDKRRVGDDPLSELARLMDSYEGANADPYGRILAEPESPARAPAVELRGSYDAAPPAADEAPHYEAAHYDPAHYHEPAFDAAAEPAYPDERDYYQAQADGRYYAEPPVEAPAYDPAYHGGAEGGWTDDSQYLDYGQAEEEYEQDEPRRLGGWLRPWHAVVAISLVAVASIGFAFWHRNGSDASREIATIVAPEGPVKVRPTTDAGTSAPDAGTAVLDRKDPTPVKQVVANQEQAVDPTVSPRVVQLGNGPVNAPHEAAPPSAAQPRRVKTVTVRPDGSPVENEALPPAVAKATRPPPAAEPAPDATTGGTPSSAAKPATTPKPVAKVKPPAPPKVAAVEEPPAGEAEEAAAPTSKGGFAVQFGAAGTEAEARALMKTVAAKYGAQLGGLKPTFKMATVNDKTVYRVRVAGVSKDSANAICAKVKAGGGACFVAGN